MRARGLWAILLCCALTLPLTPPALADETAPEIASFRRSSPDVGLPLQPVVMEFTATDQGGSGMEYGMFTFRGPTGGIFRVDSLHLQGSFEGTFQATKLVGPWAAAGEYVLEKVEVYDREHNMRTYERATATQFDFAQADFHVDNPNQDITAPVVTWAQIWDETVNQGEPAVALYEASDENSGIESVTFTVMGPLGSSVNMVSLPALAESGPASWIVPPGSPIATYEILSVTVIDRAGNSLTYSRDQGRSVYPERTIIPSHTGVDPTGLRFSVESSSNDTDAPQITSLEPLTPAVRTPGDQIAADFEASDGGVGVDRVHLLWEDEAGHELEAWKRCGDRTSGPISVTLEPYRTVDRDWRLTHAIVSDRLDHQTIYYRDGTWLSHATVDQQGTHGLDLARFDFRIEAGELSAPQFPDTSKQWCPAEAIVSLSTDDPLSVAGEPVDLVGKVATGERSVETPVVAIHEIVEGEPRFLTVVQGSAEGRFQERLTPVENTTVRATFLGSERAGGADPARSPEIEIAVGPRITAELRRATVPVGSSAVLSGTIWPEQGGELIGLQRKTRKGWRSIASKRLSAESTYRFRWLPSRSGSYRVVKAPDQDHARGISPVRTIRMSGS